MQGEADRSALPWMSPQDTQRQTRIDERQLIAPELGVSMTKRLDGKPEMSTANSDEKDEGKADNLWLPQANDVLPDIIAMCFFSGGQPSNSPSAPQDIVTQDTVDIRLVF